MFMVKVEVSQQYNIYLKTAILKKSIGFMYLGLAVALATWYNVCKCDKRMSPVMRPPSEKSVLF